MDLNFITFGYLFLRLAPFIIVCFFVLGSIFNQDFKGVVYLFGLMVACFISLMLGKFNKIEDSKEICKTFTIGGVDLNGLPIGQTVFGYSSAYLLYKAFADNNIWLNLQTIVFFSVLIFGDAVWNIAVGCYDLPIILSSLCVGILVGMFWGYIINSTNTPSLQYYAGISNTEVCSKPAKSTFKCNVYKGGKLLTTM